MESRTIVAIEIASSKIKGAVGSFDDGQLSVLAVEEIAAKNNVRYGRVQNIREVTTAVNEIIRRLENSPAVAPRKIQAAVLSIGGRSITGTPATASQRFQRECEITDSHVQRLIYEATRDFVGEKAIVDTLPRCFFVNNSEVKRVVGTFGETIRGEFMMVTCGKETKQNLRRIKIDGVDPEKIFYQLRPTAVAEFVLTSDEKEVGCALVDVGAETSTVAIYKDGTLAFLSTLPMGSRLITLDLMAGLGVAEETAENFKITLGSASGEEEEDKNSNAAEVNSYVRARAGEIAANIQNQIDASGIPGESLSKIVLTGGGAKLPEFAAMLSQLTKIPVRVADMPADVVFRVAGCNNADNIDVVSLLDASVDLDEPDCLTPVAVPPVVEEPEEEVPVYKDPEPEYEPDPEPESPVRRKSRLDDEDLLEDDPDEEEYPEETSKKGHSIFRFGKNKKRYSEPDPEPEDEEEEEYDEEEEEEDPEVYDNRNGKKSAKKPENIDEVKGVLGHINNLFVKFFSTPEENDENE